MGWKLLTSVRSKGKLVNKRTLSQAIDETNMLVALF
jgi:hypothetical protein